MIERGRGRRLPQAREPSGAPQDLRPGSPAALQRRGSCARKASRSRPTRCGVRPRDTWVIALGCPTCLFLQGRELAQAPLWWPTSGEPLPASGKTKAAPLETGGAGGEGALAWARHPSVRAPPHCAGPAFLREPRSRPSLPHPAHGLDQEANDQGAASVGSVVSPLSPPRIHCSSCFYPATEFFKAASGPRAWDQV